MLALVVEAEVVAGAGAGSAMIDGGSAKCGVTCDVIVPRAP